MMITGTFRIYFNRMQATLLVWCIAPVDGGWELTVPAVELRGVVAITKRIKKEIVDDVNRLPSAWIEVTGKLIIDGNLTRIEGTKFVSHIFMNGICRKCGSFAMPLGIDSACGGAFL